MNDKRETHQRRIGAIQRYLASLAVPELMFIEDELSIAQPDALRKRQTA